MPFCGVHGAVVIAVGKRTANGHAVARHGGEQGVAFFAVAGDGVDVAGCCGLRGRVSLRGGGWRAVFSGVGGDEVFDGVLVLAQKGGVFFGEYLDEAQVAACGGENGEVDGDGLARYFDAVADVGAVAVTFYTATVKQFAVVGREFVGHHGQPGDFVLAVVRQRVKDADHEDTVTDIVRGIVGHEVVAAGLPAVRGVHGIGTGSEQDSEKEGFFQHVAPMACRNRG